MSVLDQLKAKRVELIAEQWRLHEARLLDHEIHGGEIMFCSQIHDIQNEINKLNVRIRNITGENADILYCVDGEMI